MEPDRYWFLYFGLLFVFLGSRVGLEICWRAFNLVRACFYIMLALLAGAAATVLEALHVMLLRYVDRKWAKRETHEAAKDGT